MWLVLFFSVKVLLVYWLCVKLYLKARSEIKLHRKLVEETQLFSHVSKI